MGLLLRLLTLILCVELIVGPIQPRLSLISSPAFAQQSCPTGFTYDSTLNRCLTKDETTAVINATTACESDVECYKNNAKSALQTEVNKGKAPQRKGSNQFVSQIANIAAVAGPVTIFAMGMSKATSSCSSSSFYAMVGGSAALIAGDLMANMQHKKRLKEIENDWGKIVNPEQANGDKDKEREASIESQSQAFEMLARAEDSLAKAAKMKKTFFTVASLAYGVSAGLALVEQFNPWGSAAYICKTQEKPAEGGTPAADAPAESVGSEGVQTSPLPDPPAVETTPIDGSTVSVESNGLFKYYASSGKKFEYMDRTQFYYNLAHSKDLVSFVMNKHAMEKSNSSPSLEFYEVAKTNVEEIDSSSFEMFKKVITTFVHKMDPFPSAHAQLNTNASAAYKSAKTKNSNILLTAIVGGAGGYALGKSGIANKLASPAGRAIFSGVMMGLTIQMAKHAAGQAEASNKRSELLRKMRDDFVTASGAIYTCKSEDRNDPGKPSCYCYTPENTRNPNRNASSICQKMWAGKNLTPNNNIAAASNSPKVCINNSNQTDPTCACKKNQSCMKVGINGLKGLNTGTFSMLSQSLDPINKIATGDFDAANVDTASLENQAVKVQALNKSLENDKRLENFKKSKDKNVAAALKDLTKAASGLGAGSMLGNSSGPSMPSNPGEAARMLEKELDSSETPRSVGGGNDSIATQGNGPTNENLEFGLTQDGLAAQETQVAEVMKQDLDYGGNDTNTDAKANIFEVLSQRYQRSGMKRLFEETPPAATTPAATDTNTAQK